MVSAEKGPWIVTSLQGEAVREKACTRGKAGAEAVKRGVVGAGGQPPLWRTSEGSRACLLWCNRFCRSFVLAAVLVRLPLQLRPCDCNLP